MRRFWGVSDYASIFDKGVFDCIIETFSYKLVSELLKLYTLVLTSKDRHWALKAVFGSVYFVS